MTYKDEVGFDPREPEARGPEDHDAPLEWRALSED
jgi:hypothetical protein